MRKCWDKSVVHAVKCCQIIPDDPETVVCWTLCDRDVRIESTWEIDSQYGHFAPQITCTTCIKELDYPF